MLYLLRRLRKTPEERLQEQLNKLLLSSGDTLALTRALSHSLYKSLIERDRTRMHLMQCVELLEKNNIPVPPGISESPF